jgi:hypothetical protein
MVHFFTFLFLERMHHALCKVCVVITQNNIYYRNLFIFVRIYVLLCPHDKEVDAEGDAG